MKLLLLSSRILLLMAPLLLLGCKKESTVAPPVTQEITGLAVDEQGYIVPNANIEALSQANQVMASDVTNDFGQFSLKNLPGDLSAMKLRITHSDFKEFVGDLNSLKGTNPTIVVQITHTDSACGSLSLLVRDVTNLNPIAGAQVKLMRNGLHVTTVPTDSTGRVAFNYLIAGQYALRITKQGYQTIERSATIQYCDSSSMDLRMIPVSGGSDTCCDGSLKVLVKNATTNEILIGATVKLTRSGIEPRILTSGQTGVEFHDLCVGEYGVRISKSGFQVMEFGVNIPCNQTVELVKLLQPETPDSCCNGTVQVTVRDSVTSNTLSNATVKLWKNGKIHATTSTNSSGLALFSSLCPGSYGVSIFRDGYKAREGDFTLGCNEQLERTFSLLPSTPDSCCTAKLKFRVVDSTASQGGWLQGVAVTIRHLGNVIASGTTDVEGWYFRENLCSPATYNVTFEKTGFQTKVIDVTFNECKIISETIKLSP